METKVLCRDESDGGSWRALETRVEIKIMKTRVMETRIMSVADGHGTQRSRDESHRDEGYRGAMRDMETE